MVVKIKSLIQQVFFITEATTDLGLSLVHLAAEQGCKIFMVSSDEQSLKYLQDDMIKKGYVTAYAVCDVSQFDQLHSAVENCLQSFNRIDTFINNSFQLIPVNLLNPELSKMKTFFDKNFWSVIQGCTLGIKVMKESGGVMINVVGPMHKSFLGENSFDVISMNAIKLYSQQLKIEIQLANLPIKLYFFSPHHMLKHLHINFSTGTPQFKELDYVAKRILKLALGHESLYQSIHLEDAFKFKNYFFKT